MISASSNNGGNNAFYAKKRDEGHICNLAKEILSTRNGEKRISVIYKVVKALRLYVRLESFLEQSIGSRILRKYEAD